MIKELLVRGNSKMGEKVYHFSLPPIITCTPTSWCLKGRNGKPSCYATRNQYTFTSVREALRSRLRLSYKPDFVDKMIQEIKKKKVVYFRLHASGDFYSPEYVQKITEIVRECPDTMFRTTTRRRDFKGLIQKLNELPNCIIRESLDDERPLPIMGLPFAALSHLPVVKESTTLECEDDCAKCGYHCWKKPVNICFPKK
jgi:hypothetical protein